jgi:Bacterial regulatory helix-turn-helix protein, lysR family
LQCSIRCQEDGPFGDARDGKWGGGQNAGLHTSPSLRWRRTRSFQSLSRSLSKTQSSIGGVGSSPPAVSRRVKALEARLGVGLADRSARRFRLTDEGALYYEHCRTILKDLRDAEAEVAARGATPKRRWPREARRPEAS